MRKGFTLIELLAVIAIIAILAVVGGYTMGKVMKKVKLNALTDTAFSVRKSVGTYMISDFSAVSDNEYIELNITPPNPDAPVGSSARLGGTYSYLVDLSKDPWGNPFEALTAHVTKTTDSKNITHVYMKTTNGCFILWHDTAELYQDYSCDGLIKPPLLNGLIPIVYNTATTKWQVADTKGLNNPGGEYWYWYSKGKWANAISVTTTAKSKYIEDNEFKVGTEISAGDILGYFVYIPRYSYTLYRGTASIANDYAGGTITAPGTIDIKFITSETKETGAEIVASGINIGDPYYKNTTKTNPTNYLTHPAFTFGNEELEGIWIGKFKTSASGGTPRTLPNVTAWNNINISTMFSNSQKFNTSTYGLTAVDAHMMKASEWGAVAFLSQSLKGRCSSTTSCTEVYRNSSNTTGAGNYIENTNQSTTHNIYGIYDMSGQGHYLMTKYAGEYGTSGYSSTVALPSAKYYHEYTTTNPQTACNGKPCFGHATLETAGWYNDISSSVSTTYPWMARGDWYYSQSDHGLFNYASYTGGIYSRFGFYTVLAPLK